MITLRQIVAVFIYFAEFGDRTHGWNNRSNENKLLSSLNNNQYALFLSSESEHSLDLLEAEQNVTAAPDYEDITSTVNYKESSTSSDLPTSTVDSLNVTDVSKFGNESATNGGDNNKRPLIRKHDEICSCDLILTVCDINCCCDPLCTDQQKSLFTRCVDEMPKTKSNKLSCRSREFYYKNNTRYNQIINSNGFFCIIKDNLPPEKDDEYKIITSLKDLEKLYSRFHSWRKKSEKVEPSTPNRNHVSICLNGAAYPLTIPSSVFHSHCERREFVSHFENVKSKCLSKLADLEMFDLNYFYNGSACFLRNVTSPEENCTHTECVKCEILACNLENCVSFNLTEHMPFCNDDNCFNIVTKIRFTFFTNTTSINAASIELYLINISWKKLHIWQDIEVKFYLGNGSEKYYEMSGNPGYIVGKPIIAIQDLLLSNGSKIDDIGQTSNYPLRNIISLPKNINGNCILNNLTHETLNFGENFQRRCTFTFGPINLRNATLVCREIQRRVFAALGVFSRTKRYISSFGNPFFSTAKVPLLYDVSESLEGFEGTEEMLCYHLVTEVLYEFSYVVTPDGYNRVMGAVARLNAKRKPHDFSVRFMTLETSAVWHRASTPLRQLDATPPSLYIALPQDFFYPFTSKSCKNNYLEIYLLIFVCLAML